MKEVTEEHPKQTHTRKGKTRIAYEQMLFSTRWSRAQVMIVRLLDYYGPSANQASYLGSTLEAIAKGKMAFFIGNMKVPREYIYLPDAAGRSKPVLAIGKVGLSVIGLGVPVMKEIVEMLYLTENPLILRRQKYVERIGPVVATSFEEGIALTIKELELQGE